MRFGIEFKRATIDTDIFVEAWEGEDWLEICADGDELFIAWSQKYNKEYHAL